jgi:PAS domain S-box-containing protein
MVAKRPTSAPGTLEAALATFALAPDELYVLDLEGHIVDANARACEALGYARAELLGRHVSEVSTRQTEIGFQILLEGIRSEGSQYLFGHNKCKDGTTYAVEARLWLGEIDGTTRVLALLRDARGYQSLIEERDQLISLIENSSEVIAVATPEGVYSYMNPAGLALVGAERVEELVGRSVLDLHPADEHEVLRRTILPQVRAGRWEGELHYKNLHSGALVPVWLAAFAIRHSQTGETIAIAAVAHDIRARKEAERHREGLMRLNETSRRVATTLLEQDDLSRAISLILEGVGSVLGVTHASLFRYRKDRQWVVRTHAWSRGEDRARLIEPVPEPAERYGWATRQLVQGQAIRVADVARAGIEGNGAQALNGTEVRALLVLPVLIHGRLESFFSFVDSEAAHAWEDEEFSILQIMVDSFAHAVERRIAERERQLIARDLERAVAREKAANRYKSEFLANMSHELRTPMNAIVGYAELLGRPNVDRLKQEAWVANIKRSTDHLLSLINDVLDLSKIEAGQMTLHAERCELAPLMGEVESLLRGQAEEKLLTLRVEYDGPVPQAIQTDAVRFKQVLINLVGNAIKFTHRGGVTIRLRLDRGTPDDPGALRVAVVDTGIGIAPEALKDLFLPFSQVHARRGARFGGTGLGLDISRHLARLLGGDIEVESQVNLGSTFTFRLDVQRLDDTEVAIPARTAASERAHREREQGTWLAGRRILVVDDSADNREVLGFLLAEAGAVWEPAENGRVGVEKALQAQRTGQAFDAILMDMNMPVLDGFAATSEIVRSGVSAPVIALTACAFTEDEQRSRAAGCVDFVTKPIVPSSFFETIARHVRAASSPPPAAGAPVSLASNPRFAPLVARYVGSFPEFAARLRSSLRAGALDEVRTHAHRLRGTAANYGFPEISLAAGAVEDALRAQRSPAEIHVALDELVRLLERRDDGRA